MQNYRVVLQSAVSNTFRCTKACNSLDIDPVKKSIHELQIKADVTTDYKLGLIIGASGSGKTTLAKNMFGAHCFDFSYDDEKPVLDQFPEHLSYDECAQYLLSIGLTSVPCWVRPMKTLSNGQKTRAIVALQMASNSDFIVIDEWTSVVDRTVAKAMSNCVQKFARKHNKKIVLLSCHYDVVDWLNPCFIIDCNKQEYINRRLLWRDFKRTEQLHFDIKEVDRKTWKYFSKYHYLSENLPCGVIKFYGLFHGNNQIGFQCFANYTPCRKGQVMIMHSNRTVIHPDYVGLGLGILLINETTKLMKVKNYRIMAKFSSVPVKKAFDKYKELWKLRAILRLKQNGAGNIIRKTGYRENIKTYSYEYIG